MEILVRNEQRPQGVHITISGRPLRGRAGAPKGGVLVFRDITRLKRSEANLDRALLREQDQAHLMETIFSSISDGIIVADATGRFLYVNPAAERICGMGLTDGPLEEWAGKYGILQSDRETVMKTEDLPLVRAIRRGESTDEVDLFLRNLSRPDGVYVRVSARPLLDNISGIRGGVSVFRDVTGRVLAEEALAQAFAQGRLEVVDTILHNIGNAINSVTTGVETLRQRMVNDRAGGRLFALAAAVRDHEDDWVEYIRDDPQGRQVRPFILELSQGFSRQNEDLIKTVSRVRERANHIADIVRTQKTGASSQRKDIDLHEALAGALRVLRDSLSKRGIDSRIDCRNAPAEIRIQESQFHQMLVNLVKNSIEAIDDLARTREIDAPRIRIRASVEDPFLMVEVIDNGIGIREGDREVLFAPGYTTKRQGSGLGLHSAANFVIASGGQIEALSAGTGQGATMRVTLPLILVGPPDDRGEECPLSLFLGPVEQRSGWSKSMKTGDLENKRVLIVDDQQEIHDDFMEVLRPLVALPSQEGVAAAFMGEEEEPFLPEFELLHARSGEEALEIIRQGQESDRPVAVAYIDIRMPPGMDGIETIRRVRQVDRDVEIVIMTAYTDRSLAEIVQDLELLHKLLYIRKPFAHEEIQQITLSLVGKWNVERELEGKRRQLTTSHRRLEAVLNATGDAIAMHDGDGRLVFANQEFEGLVGLKEKELRQIPPDDLAARLEERFREPDLGEVEGRGVLDRGSVVEITGSGQVPDRRLLYRSTAPVIDDRGERMGSLVLYRDVSQEIEAERMKAEVLRLRRELETTTSFAGMVGNSPAMRQVYALMKQAVEGDIAVLIRGESGTGKELVAKSFHLNSPRRQGPFVAVNCAAIPGTLIESELFGHERGSFTGATEQRTGAFERAHGGTILLDEIGDMPYDLQGKLLRVLQEREIQRVGASAPTPVDIRVVTATNKDLEHAVEAGEFRQDLFYRVAAFPIAVPPLRERREDIPLLTRHFLDKHAARAGKSIEGPSTAALRLLLQYDWPGNVRELENAIERAVLLETGPVLQAANLPPRMSPVLSEASGSPSPSGVLPLAEVERQALTQALEVADNNVTQAARALGINRSTLHRKLKKYDLSRG